MSLEDRVPTTEFDPDQLERLMVAAFELLGKRRGEAQELARAILKAAERLSIRRSKSSGSEPDVTPRALSKPRVCALTA